MLHHLIFLLVDINDLVLVEKVDFHSNLILLFLLLIFLFLRMIVKLLDSLSIKEAYRLL